VTNTGDENGTQTVEFRVAGDALASENVSLAGGANETVEFTGIDTSGLDAGNYTHGVYTDGDADRRSGLITTKTDAPAIVGDSPAQDLDGDGTFEDTNGDGAFDIVDVNALFQNSQS
jgi:hypothetical protein